MSEENLLCYTITCLNVREGKFWMLGNKSVLKTRGGLRLIKSGSRDGLMSVISCLFLLNCRANSTLNSHSIPANRTLRVLLMVTNSA